MNYLINVKYLVRYLTRANNIIVFFFLINLFACFFFLFISDVVLVSQQMVYVDGVN